MANFNKHLIVVGSARSGTSWLSETLAQPFRYRMLFEPEEETRTKNGHLLCDKWLTTKLGVTEVNRYLTKVFKNRVDCDWIAQNSNRKFKRHLWPFIPKKIIIKFVRANLSAKYMNENFKIPLIHIIRNPYEVIKSQKRANFPWLIDLSHFLKQERLVELIKNEFNFDISEYKEKTTTEILTIRWCIENVIPLEILEPYQYQSKVIKYEDLIKDVGVFMDLCNTFNLEFIDNIENFYRQPSTKTHSKSVIKTKEEKNISWDAQEINEVNQILSIFQTKLYPIRNI